MLNRSYAVLYGTKDEADEASPLRLASRVVLMTSGATPSQIADAWESAATRRIAFCSAAVVDKA